MNERGETKVGGSSATRLIVVLVFGAFVFGTFVIGVCSFSGRATARDLKALYPKAKFAVGSAKIDAFVADDDQRRGQGLMDVTHLDAHEGMLFVFGSSQTLRFWMKNTRIPLAIGFFDRTCRLVETIEMKVADSVLSKEIPTYQSRVEARFALEMNQGWFKRNAVPNGAKLVLSGPVDSPTLREALVECK